MELPEQPRLIRYETTDSTNERAFASIADGTARHGDVHWARLQTEGRGRLGRVWQARDDEGLLFSLVLCPGTPCPKATELTVATCLAVYDAARELGLASARLKWPNDVLVGEAKLCGILIETRGLDAQNPHFVVGVGINVKQTEFPRELTDERPVTSFLLESVHIVPAELLLLIWKKLAQRTQQDRASLFEDYTDALALESKVLVRSAQNEVRGQLVAVSPDHGVRVRVENGEIIDTPLEFVRELRTED